MTPVPVVLPSTVGRLLSRLSCLPLYIFFGDAVALLCFEKAIRLSREILVFRVIGDLKVNQGFISDESHICAVSGKNRPEVSCYASFTDWLI